ncbi:hypothetical protein ABG82_24620 [Mycobacteroides immunogenum]|uniref:Uncharacterized protein n=1 Tax=Mycobacteroides immunogenum TaxID=83262 RepID=A0A7V8LU57_9MYCO|nr:hypothetical protein ABG82_24620 [Mycobacteroides immunogenum]ANO07324.1 hypothetical protein BAB75_24885 [Mycobacteroides immunogenum]KIU41944.1 hypothetical protein TL11_05020 [Mycobacteroides immunogenum]KPG11705.1 hypothetical protein AN909_09520 [Mycobacteroides immunogenum]KPG11807.1 hypothetical protein AN910_12160 [Mycobacteroides immunogenum]
MWGILYLFLILAGAQRIDLRTATSIVIFIGCFGYAIAHGADLLAGDANIGADLGDSVGSLTGQP